MFGTLHCLFHKSCTASVSVFEAACPGALVPPYIDWLSPAVCFRSPLLPLQFLPASLCYLQRLSTLTVTTTVKQLVKRTLLIKNTSVCLSACLSLTNLALQATRRPIILTKDNSEVKTVYSSTFGERINTNLQ